MDISANVRSLNTANASVKSVQAANLFPGCLIVNRDIELELWRVDSEGPQKLNYVTNYKVRNKILEIKTFK